MQKILQKSMQENCQKLTVGVLDFPAPILAPSENKKDYTEDSQDYSLKLLDFLSKQKKKIDLNGCSLKMLEICCQAKKDLMSQG